MIAQGRRGFLTRLLAVAAAPAILPRLPLAAPVAAVSPAPVVLPVLEEAFNPLHFGNMAWKPELVLVMSRVAGASIRELTVQPHFQHVASLPIMGALRAPDIPLPSDRPARLPDDWTWLLDN